MLDLHCFENFPLAAAGSSYSLVVLFGFLIAVASLVL